MITGVTLGGRHCFGSFRLVMTDRKIGLPSVQSISVEVPGRDGTIDLTEVLDGHVHYGNRVIEMTFGTFEPLSGMEWSGLLARFANYVHGRRMSIVFDDDPMYYYMGRAEISQYELDTATTHQQITLSFDCEPYKLQLEESAYLYTLTEEDSVLSIDNGRRAVVPTFVAGTESVLTWKGQQYAIPSGTSVIEDIVFEYGLNELWGRAASGSGSLAVRFRRGDL